MIIGKFTTGEHGRIEGAIETLCGEIGVVFVPASKGADYDVITDGGCELGAAWKKTSKEKGTAYLSVQVDSPFLPKAINCALFSKNGTGEHQLVWERQQPRQD